MGWTTAQSPSGQLYDLPIIGGDLAKIGRIIQIYATPCSPYFEVWVYAFWQAIPTLFITLTKPELIDVDIHKGSHRPRKGRRARFRASAVFRDSLVTLPVPNWRVFRIYEMYQRVGWYFLVADALEDFSINWMSMAYKMAGCTQTQLCYARFDAVHRLQGSSGTPQSRRFTWNVLAQDNCNIDTTFIQPVLDGTFQVTWNTTFSPYEVESQSQMPFSTHLTVNSVPTTIGETYDAGNGRMGASGHSRGDSFGIDNPIFRVAGAWTDENKFCYMDGSFSLDRVEDDEIEPDP